MLASLSVAAAPSVPDGITVDPPIGVPNCQGSMPKQEAEKQEGLISNQQRSPNDAETSVGEEI